MTQQKKCFLIIDSNALIHRAYHALPYLTTKKGEIVNAVYGFLLVFLKITKELQPDFIAVAFDFPAPTFRHKKYKKYKAKRPPTPKELFQQIPKVKEALRVFNIQVFEKQGIEADDIIGTIAVSVLKKQVLPKIEIIILSGDSDMFQLVNSQTKVYALRRGVKDVVLYDKKLVKEKFQGLEPKQLLDFKSLKGDPSDNIPGVTGIGEKTAIKLLLEFNSLDNLYQEIKKNSKKTQKINPNLKETLIKYKEQAFLSKSLVEIKIDALIDFNLEKCQWKGYNKGKVIEFFKKLGFYSLINRV